MFSQYFGCICSCSSSNQISEKGFIYNITHIFFHLSMDSLLCVSWYFYTCNRVSFQIFTFFTSFRGVIRVMIVVKG